MRNTNKRIVRRIANFIFILLLLVLSQVLNYGSTQAAHLVKPFVYVSNVASNDVSVIDANTNLVVATVPVGGDPRSLDISPDGRLVYVANFASNNVTVIDTSTNTVIATVGVGGNPQAVRFTPDGTQAYVINRSSSTASVIDTSTHSVLTTIGGLGTWPHGIDFTPDGLKAYVPNSRGSSVSVIDTVHKSVVKTIGVGNTPNWVEITKDGRLAYVSVYNSQRVYVIDIATDSIVTTILNGGNPTAIVFKATADPHRFLAYVTDFTNNKVNIIDTSIHAIVATIPNVGLNTHGITISADGSLVYTANITSNDVAVIDTSTNTIIDFIPISGGPSGIDFSLVSIPNQPPTADAGGPYNENEGDTVTLDASNSSDPDDNIVSYAWDLDNDGDYDDATGVSTNVTFDDDGSYPVSVLVTDAFGETDVANAVVSVSNVVPTVDDISVDLTLVPVGTAINAIADFTDAGVLDTHTAAWDWGDGTSFGTVTQGAGFGSVNDSHSYSTPGVYTVKLTVTDDDGGVSNEAIYQFVIVYDPEGGFVTGGGWIWSPAGAYADDPSLEGKATFGFVSKYKKGANVPTGVTEFRFTLADLNFKSTSYDWLVVAGTRAQFFGQGTINGEGDYNFMLTALDADLNESDVFELDRFRIRIWYEDANGNEIGVYDNGLGGEDGNDNALTEIGGGSIVIHNPKGKGK